MALPLKASRRCTGRIFAFLPTELDTGLPFYINADFLLTSSRDSLLDDRHWNEWLRDTIAPTFVKAFLAIINDPNWPLEGYRCIPVKSDLFAGADFFAPVVDAALESLRAHPCVRSEDGDLCLPSKVWFAGPLTRRLLADVPLKQYGIWLVDPALEAASYRKRVGLPEGLGVNQISIAQILSVCSDCDWLGGRDNGWWEDLFDLLAQLEVSAVTIGSFRLLPCQDGVCRPISSGAFRHPDGSAQTLHIQSEWPSVHFLHIEIQSRIKQKPKVYEWLIRVAGIPVFSAESYIFSRLLNWMRHQNGDKPDRIIEATSFIALNLLRPEDHKEALRANLPWLLSDLRVLLPEARGEKELITPECIEAAPGWNWVFISQQDRQHFWLLSNAYIEGQPQQTQGAVLRLMNVCGANGYPDPARMRGPGGELDWISPRWIRDLDMRTPPQNVEIKLAALERWISKFRPEQFIRFLTIASDDAYRGCVTPPSEIGTALRIRQWLRSTKGTISPSQAFVNNPETREFLGDSVAYSLSTVSSDVLSKLGTRVSLSSTTLIGLLRQMRDDSSVDEALVVRIFRRLQTQEFDPAVFRAEPLIYLAVPSPRWMQASHVYWNDPDSIFDDRFGCARLTYEKEELLSFFVDRLGVLPDVPDEQLGEVWEQMCGSADVEASVVEKRLALILPRLAVVNNLPSAPSWWARIRPRLMVWTAARCFESPSNVYAPDDSGTERLFANAVRIAWKPKEIAWPPFNRLLAGMGCRSLAKSLRSRVTGASDVRESDVPSFLTSTSKEVLVCWICNAESWKSMIGQLECLLGTSEVRASELKVEYWLEGSDAVVSDDKVAAFWSIQDRRLFLLNDATRKAQQDAAASSISKGFDRHIKSSEDTVYRLLGLEVADGIRELEERQWQLTKDQIDWFRSIGRPPAVVNLGGDSSGQCNRESRPAIAPPASPLGDSAPASHPLSPLAKGGVENSRSSTSPISTGSPGSKSSGPQGSDAGSGAARKDERSGEPTGGRGADSREKDASCLLKASDADAEFVHVASHTRRHPGRARQSGNASVDAIREQHPLAKLPQASKLDIEQKAVELVLRQFGMIHSLRDFKVHDERKRNLGYDLIAAKPGRVLRVEIKAHLREAKSVFVTQREWQQSKQRDQMSSDDKWELWNVENLAADAGKVRITRYSVLPDSARTRESGYWVDLNSCQVRAFD